jgi:hypothetical protein
MTLWSMVGHASLQTARGMGPSTMERSNLFAEREGADINTGKSWTRRLLASG